jgi:hypothetical protein
MSALLAGFAGLIAREIIQYLGGLITSYLAKVQKDKEDHAKAVNQAALDNEKAQAITPESKSDDVDQAITDSLHHL